MSKKQKESFFSKIWVKITGVVLSIAALITIGANIGSYKGELDCKIEKIEIITDYQEKLQSQNELCNSIKMSKIQTDVDDLQEFVELLKSKTYEK